MADAAEHFSVFTRSLFYCFFILFVFKNEILMVSTRHQHDSSSPTLFRPSGPSGSPKNSFMSNYNKKKFGSSSGGEGNLPSSFPEGLSPDGSHYKTDYRCEGETMVIDCSLSKMSHKKLSTSPQEYVVDVLRANFGRFSIAICNRHGHTHWSVNCMAPDTTQLLKDRCNGKSRCEIPVQPNSFSDACPGTTKYLEIHYACIPKNVPASASNNPPKIPPWMKKSSTDGLLQNGNGNVKKLARRPDIPNGDENGRRRQQDTSAADIQSAWQIASGSSSQSSSDGKITPLDSSPGHLRKPILVTESPIKSGSDQRVPITTPATTTDTTVHSSSSDEKAHGMRRFSIPGRKGQPVRRLKDKLSLLPSQIDIVDEVRSNSAHSPLGMLTVHDRAGTLENQHSEICSPTTVRQLQWDATSVGRERVQSCPIGTVGEAKWYCGVNPNMTYSNGRTTNSEGHMVVKLRGQGIWWPKSSPDMSRCVSNSIDTLLKQLNLELPSYSNSDGEEIDYHENGLVEDSSMKEYETPDSLIISSLSYLTRTKSLYGGDILASIEIMNEVTKKLKKKFTTKNGKGSVTSMRNEDTTTLLESQKQQTLSDSVRQILQNIVKSVNNILEDSKRVAWNSDLSSESGQIGNHGVRGGIRGEGLANFELKMRSVSKMFNVVEEIAFLMARTMPSADVFLESTDVLTMAISALDISDPLMDQIIFPAPTSNLLYVEDSIVLSGRDLRSGATSNERSDSSSNTLLSNVVFFSYSNLHEILADAKIYLSSGSVLNDEKSATTDVDDSWVINSHIISGSISHRRLTGLLESAEVTLIHMKPIHIISGLDKHNSEAEPEVICVYWDKIKHAWSDSGCEVWKSNATQTECKCSHLSHFALFANSKAVCKVSGVRSGRIDSSTASNRKKVALKDDNGIGGNGRGHHAVLTSRNIDNNEQFLVPVLILSIFTSVLFLFLLVVYRRKRRVNSNSSSTKRSSSTSSTSSSSSSTSCTTTCAHSNSSNATEADSEGVDRLPPSICYTQSHMSLIRPSNVDFEESMKMRHTEGARSSHMESISGAHSNHMQPVAAKNGGLFRSIWRSLVSSAAEIGGNERSDSVESNRVMGHVCSSSTSFGMLSPQMLPSPSVNNTPTGMMGHQIANTPSCYNTNNPHNTNHYTSSLLSSNSSSGGNSATSAFQQSSTTSTTNTGNEYSSISHLCPGPPSGVCFQNGIPSVSCFSGSNGGFNRQHINPPNWHTSAMNHHAGSGQAFLSMGNGSGGDKYYNCCPQSQPSVNSSSNQHHVYWEIPDYNKSGVNYFLIPNTSSQQVQEGCTSHHQVQAMHNSQLCNISSGGGVENKDPLQNPPFCMSSTAEDYDMNHENNNNNSTFLSNLDDSNFDASKKSTSFFVRTGAGRYSRSRSTRTTSQGSCTTKASKRQKRESTVRNTDSLASFPTSFTSGGVGHRPAALRSSSVTLHLMSPSDSTNVETTRGGRPTATTPSNPSCIRSITPHVPSASSSSTTCSGSTSVLPQMQVQIRDVKPIHVPVKSSEYIEAKIRTLRKARVA